MKSAHHLKKAHSFSDFTMDKSVQTSGDRLTDWQTDGDRLTDRQTSRSTQTDQRKVLSYNPLISKAPKVFGCKDTHRNVPKTPSTAGFTQTMTGQSQANWRGYRNPLISKMGSQLPTKTVCINSSLPNFLTYQPQQTRYKPYEVVYDGDAPSSHSVRVS